MDEALILVRFALGLFLDSEVYSLLENTKSVKNNYFYVSFS